MPPLTRPSGWDVAPPDLAVAAAARANPDAEGEMLDLAEEGVGQGGAGAVPPDPPGGIAETDEQRVLQAQRRRTMWHWIDDDNGDGCGKWRFPPAEHAEVIAELNRRMNGFFDQGRRENRHESQGAYMADALVDLVRHPGPPRIPANACTDPPAAATEPGSPKIRSRRNARPIYRIDANAIDRGHALPGERCEAAGIGPISIGDAIRSPPPTPSKPSWPPIPTTTTRSSPSPTSATSPSTPRR